MQTAAPLDNKGGMLSIGKLGKGQERYYLNKVAAGAEDYYSGEGEQAGEWIGDAAARLGLDGEVGEDQLVAMLTGRNPVDGEPLLGIRGLLGFRPLGLGGGRGRRNATLAGPLKEVLGLDLPPKELRRYQLVYWND